MEIWRGKLKEGDMGRRMVWERMEWPETWKVGVIVPLKKEGKDKKIEDYKDRGLQRITLPNILYKVYTAVLGH